jgi:hypothetical protein
LRPGTACIFSVGPASHGCQPDWGRYQWRRIRFPAISFSSDVAAVCNLRRANLSLLFFHTTGSWGAWHVWIQRRKARTPATCKTLNLDKCKISDKNKPNWGGGSRIGSPQWHKQRRSPNQQFPSTMIGCSMSANASAIIHRVRNIAVAIALFTRSPTHPER